MHLPSETRQQGGIVHIPALTAREMLTHVSPQRKVASEFVGRLFVVANRATYHRSVMVPGT